MFANADAVPSLEEYAKTMYADAKMHLDREEEIQKFVCNKVADLARVVFYEMYPERRQRDQEAGQ